jgi:hypothetical protein
MGKIVYHIKDCKMPDDVSEPKHTAMNKLKKTGVVRDCFNTYSHDVFNTSRDVSS